MELTERLIRLRRGWLMRLIMRPLLEIVARIEMPARVEVGRGFKTIGRAAGLVLHPSTKIGNNVTISPFSGTGQLYPMDPWPKGGPPKIVIEDDVLLGTDVRVLAPREGLTVGRGTIVGAGSILTKSTGPNEIWVGIPARKIRNTPPRGSDAYRELHPGESA